MLDNLAKIYDDGGRLIGVAYSLFEGDSRFITAIELRFEAISVVFSAVSDDDTMLVNLGSLEPESSETLLETGNAAPWSTCMDLEICWAWQLTNQQGYADGVRLEFSEPGKESRAVVELIVAASAIQIFTAMPMTLA
jgi:hypothetical protein